MLNLHKTKILISEEVFCLKKVAQLEQVFLKSNGPMILSLILQWSPTTLAFFYAYLISQKLVYSFYSVLHMPGIFLITIPEKIIGTSKETKQNWTGAKNFGICFCVIFSCYDQRFYFWKGDLGTSFRLHLICRFFWSFQVS